MTEVRADDDGHEDPMAALREVMGDAAEIAALEEEIKGIINLSYAALRGLMNRMARDDVFIDDCAEFHWKYFQALTGKGFSQEAAIEIMSKQQQFPAMNK